ncbi:hypothetical protein M422DRAFT_240909 [Sphaerobolus stellatus SS14]|nr:hypothetical protein M422DRAFT_240909 [Sphaerobolus stellatus SS14]
MDPLSITSGIVGFLGFLGQVGTGLSKIISAKEDERKAIEELQQDIQYFTRIMSELDALIREAAALPGNFGQDYSRLEVCLRECNTVLQQFVDEFQPPVSKRIRLLRRFTWPLKNEQRRKNLLDLIERHKTSIQLELSFKNGRAQQDTAATIQSTVIDTQSNVVATQSTVMAIQPTVVDTQSTVCAIRDTLLDTQTNVVNIRDTVINTHDAALSTQSELSKQKMMEWLNVNLDVNSNFDRARLKCHPGTGQWFLKSADFVRFRQSDGGLCFWLHGMAGCGKTILSGSIIAELRAEVEDHPRIGLAYFFLSYTDRGKQTTFNLLSEIALQLLSRTSIIPQRISSLYELNRSRPPISVLLDLIGCLSQCFSQTFIIIDALDEIAVEERELLLHALKQIISTSTECKINFIATSRQETYLVDGFQALSLEQICLTTSLVDEDIKLYVTEIVQNEKKFSRWNDDLRTEIMQTLTDKANGMFRWVECQVESLRMCRRPYDVKEALRTLPKTLDETYRRILLAVQEKDRLYTARLLAWVTFTPEPMCVHLLAEAIVFEPESSEVDPDRRFDANDILDFCRSLFVTFSGDQYSCYQSEKWTRQDTKVALSHYSLKEYLLSDRIQLDTDLTTYSSVLARGQSYIIDVFLKYSAAFRSPHTCTKHNNCYCFRSHHTCMKYSNCYCFRHYPLLLFALDSLENIAKGHQYGQSRRGLEENIAVLLYENLSTFLHISRSHHWSLMAYLATKGLIYGVQWCISRGLDVNAMHKHGETVLSTVNLDSPENLHHVTAFLLQHGASDVISWAAGGSVWTRSPALESFVKYLYVFTYKPYPCQDIVRMLLEHGAVVNSPFYPGGTLLSAVIEHQPKDSVLAIRSLLAQYGGQPDPEFPRPDGLVDSFVGETAEYCVRWDSLEDLHYFLSLGAQIGRPVRNINKVNTLFKFEHSETVMCVTPIYFAWNIFCRPKYVTYEFNDYDWVRRILALQALSHDINVVDCVIGYAGDEDQLELEYCTALDCVTVMAEYFSEPHTCNCHLPGSPPFHLKAFVYFSHVASVLEGLGALVLPRERVSKQIWRIKEYDFYEEGICWFPNQQVE